MERMTQTGRLALIVSASLLVGACSYYGGQKLSPGADRKQVDPTGIPFTLVRPEYRLARTPPAEGEAKSTYTVTVSYEPDPSQVYTLNIRPGLLSDPDFTMILGAGGVLSSTKTTITEQATPAIKALGSFTAQLSGALAKGVFDEISPRSLLKDELADAAVDQSCKTPSTVSLLDLASLSEAPPETVASALTSRISSFADEESFAAKFHYRSPGEQACLKAIATKLDAAHKADLQARSTAWTTSLANASYIVAAESSFAESVAAAVAKSDLPALNKLSEVDGPIRLGRAKLLAEAKKAIAPGGTKKEYDKQLAKFEAGVANAAFEVSAMTAAVVQSDDQLLEQLRGRIKAYSESRDEDEKALGSFLDPHFAKASALVKAKKNVETSKAIIGIARMSDKVWRARHLIYLESEIEAISVALLRQPSLMGPERKRVEDWLKVRRQLRADAADARVLFERALELQAFIATIRFKPVEGGTAPATAEYVVARTELDEILRQIEVQRTKVLSAAQPVSAKAAPALRDVPLVVVTPDVVKASQIPGWDGKLRGEKAPDYVVVLEKAQ